MEGKNPIYKKPEYEFKEFYRVFKKYPELRGMLPLDIDQAIFDIKSDGFEGEPSWLEDHLDPPTRPDDIGTDTLIKIAEVKDPRFIPLILWCRDLFHTGHMEKIALEKVRRGLSSNFKNHDWDTFGKNPRFLDDCESEYSKAIAAGLDEVSLSNTQGLVQQYPDINISMAQFWIYIRGSIDYFNKVEASGGEMPCTQFLFHNGDYYTIGGRRRMFWHFYNNLDPMVWIMEVPSL